MIANIHEARFCLVHLQAMVEESKAVNERFRKENCQRGDGFPKKITQGTATTAAIEAFKDRPQMTCADLANIIGKTKQTASSTLARMQTKGLATKDRARPAIWRLTAKGKSVTQETPT